MGTNAVPVSVQEYAGFFASSASLSVSGDLILIRPAGIETHALSMLFYHPHRSPRCCAFATRLCLHRLSWSYFSGTTPVSTMTLCLMHPRVRDHDAGTAAERCMREGSQWLRWSRNAARPVAEALYGEMRVLRCAQAVFPERVVRGVSAFMWDVHRPPHSRLHAVMT